MIHTCLRQLVLQKEAMQLFLQGHSAQSSPQKVAAILYTNVLSITESVAGSDNKLNEEAYLSWLKTNHLQYGKRRCPKKLSRCAGAIDPDTTIPLLCVLLTEFLSLLSLTCPSFYVSLYVYLFFPYM